MVFEKDGKRKSCLQGFSWTVLFFGFWVPISARSAPHRFILDFLQGPWEALLNCSLILKSQSRFTAICWFTATSQHTVTSHGTITVGMQHSSAAKAIMKWKRSRRPMN